MAKNAEVTYTGDGVQKVFTIPFDYLKVAFITAKVGSVPMTNGTDFTVYGTQLTFTTAPANGVLVVINRVTSTDRIVSFVDGSVLNATDMTTLEVQLLHLSEETDDKVVSDVGSLVTEATAEADRAHTEADRAQAAADEAESYVNDNIGYTKVESDAKYATKAENGLKADSSATYSKTEVDAIVTALKSPFIGVVAPFPKGTVKTGWLECSGQAVSRTTYADLFAYLGTSYGAGDGSTTFNLPDYRAEFLRGWDNGRGIDSGRTLGTVQTAAGYAKIGNVKYRFSGGSSYYSSGENNQFGFADNTDTYTSDPHPRNIAVMYCIKY